MGAVSFYRECINLAWGAAAWARSTNFIITIVAPIVTYAIPNTPWFQETMPNAYVWLQQMPAWITWTPLALFLSFFIIRLLLAPYWIYRELKDEKERLALVAESKVDKKKICDKLSGFLMELDSLITDCVKLRGTKEDVQKKDVDLSQKIRAYLDSELGNKYVALYGSVAGINAPSLDRRTTGTFHGKLYPRIYCQSVRLKEFINEFS